MEKPTRLGYCQYLLSSPLNYTLTHFADHSDRFTHDMLNCYLCGDRVSPHVIWENVKPHITLTAKGVILFDDTVKDKCYAKKMGPSCVGNTVQWYCQGGHLGYRRGNVCVCQSGSRPVLAT